MTITATYFPSQDFLSVDADASDDMITLSRDAGGNILINGGAVQIQGGTPTVANTNFIQILARQGADTVVIDDTNGPLPDHSVVGDVGNDVLTGSSGKDQLAGNNDADILDGRGGMDILNGGDGDDTITGGPSADLIEGGGGNDRVMWRAGDDGDVIAGGDGFDTFELDGTGLSDPVEIYRIAGAAFVSFNGNAPSDRKSVV